jgi:hypothetical protein
LICARSGGPKAPDQGKYVPEVGLEPSSRPCKHWGVPKHRQSDRLSFIDHTLGFWPKESLACITLDTNQIGARLRIDLPKRPGSELPFARTVIQTVPNGCS